MAGKRHRHETHNRCVAAACYCCHCYIQIQAAVVPHWWLNSFPILGTWTLAQMLTSRIRKLRPGEGSDVTAVHSSLHAEIPPFGGAKCPRRSPRGQRPTWLSRRARHVNYHVYKSYSQVLSHKWRKRRTDSLYLTDTCYLHLTEAQPRSGKALTPTRGICIVL